MRVDTRLSPVRVGGDSLTRQVPEIESCDCEIVNPLLGKHLDHKKYHSLTYSLSTDQPRLVTDLQTELAEQPFKKK